MSRSTRQTTVTRATAADEGPATAAPRRRPRAATSRFQTEDPEAVAVFDGAFDFLSEHCLSLLAASRWWFPSIAQAMTTIRPETLVRWHRSGFRRYWRWKSRNLRGRPPIDAGLRALIRRMSTENVLWGASRIHGE